jgi:hypothetical protein
MNSKGAPEGLYPVIFGPENFWKGCQFSLVQERCLPYLRHLVSGKGSFYILQLDLQLNDSRNK